MRIFEDKTRIDVPGLQPYQQPVVKTEVVRYRPESGDDWRPTILYTKTEVWTDEYTPSWVMAALEEAEERGQLRVVQERANPRVRDAAVIRQAIKRHDETVSLVRAIVTAAALEQEVAKADAAVSA